MLVCLEIQNFYNNPHLLLVEDDLVNQKVFSGLLNKVGLTTTVVGDAEQALEYLMKETFDLILMDCQLPGMDGIDACKLFRKHEEKTGQTHTPVVALTAYAMKADRERCLECGMDDHISKPVDMKKFYSTLARWLPAFIESNQQETKD